EHPGGEVLLHGLSAAGDGDVLPACGRPGLLERRRVAVGDEGEGGASPHRERFACVMSEDKDRHMVGWLLTPPAPPRLVPWAVAAAKHLAAHDVGADILDHLVEQLRVGVAG